MYAKLHNVTAITAITTIQKARERLKPSHREDGTPFTHSAALANSDNTENRCCDDCVSTLRAWGCRATTRSRASWRAAACSSLKTEDFDMHWFVNRQDFINPPALRLLLLRLARTAGRDSRSIWRLDFKEQPFSFHVSRTTTGEVLFDSSVAGLIFQHHYLRLRTCLPQDTNLSAVWSERTLGLVPLENEDFHPHALECRRAIYSQLSQSVR
ncbi:hypothetical protein E4U39_003329 [Claviceps sp. Clav50 group G5]|nr:hypothetical protein E4U39_003329 [Claviceps sp. Clav50 group G5]